MSDQREKGTAGVYSLSFLCIHLALFTNERFTLDCLHVLIIHEITDFFQQILAYLACCQSGF